MKLILIMAATLLTTVAHAERPENVEFSASQCRVLRQMRVDVRTICDKKYPNRAESQQQASAAPTGSSSSVGSGKPNNSQPSSGSKPSSGGKPSGGGGSDANAGVDHPGGGDPGGPDGPAGPGSGGGSPPGGGNPPGGDLGDRWRPPRPDVLPTPKPPIPLQPGIGKVLAALIGRLPDRTKPVGPDTPMRPDKPIDIGRPGRPDFKPGSGNLRDFVRLVRFIREHRKPEKPGRPEPKERSLGRNAR